MGSKHGASFLRYSSLIPTQCSRAILGDRIARLKSSDVIALLLLQGHHETKSDSFDILLVFSVSSYVSESPPLSGI